jgi:hypothetical protein
MNQNLPPSFVPDSSSQNPQAQQGLPSSFVPDQQKMPQLNNVGANLKTPPAQGQQQQPGLVQGLVQGVTSPFTNITSTLTDLGARGAELGAYMSGNKQLDTGLIGNINNLENQGIDYGYFGKVRPLQSLGNAVSTGITGGLEASIFAPGAQTLTTSPTMQGVFKAYDMSADEYLAMSASEKADFIEGVLNDPGINASERMVLNKIYESVEPAAAQELGTASLTQSHPLLTLALQNGMKYGKYALGALGAGSLFNLGGSIINRALGSAQPGTITQ